MEIVSGLVWAIMNLLGRLVLGRRREDHRRRVEDVLQRFRSTSATMVIVVTVEQIARPSGLGVRAVGIVLERLEREGFVDTRSLPGRVIVGGWRPSHTALYG